MVTFVTLFLALITGVHPVEVAVDGPVARVELLLDPRPVGVLEGPPWQVMCDFGSSMEPHELEAVAYAEDGRVLDRARQLVNLPRPPAEVRIAFITDEQGMPRAVQVFWESWEHVEPLSLFVVLDGRVLIRDGNGHYPLPEYDPTQPHIVSAEASFLDEVTARADMTFGGRYGADVASEITAVPIAVDGRPPSVEQLDGAFATGGSPLRVAAVEQPRAQLFMVRDAATVNRLASYGGRLDRTAMLSMQHWRERFAREVQPDEDRVQLVVANPKLRRERALFPTSGPFSLEALGLPWVVTHLIGSEAQLPGQRLLDATAVAGLRAAADGTPRAVLLVVSDDPHDESGVSLANVRQYLAALRVPVAIWSVEGTPKGWDGTVDITSYRTLHRAAKRLLAELDSQWIVWVEGLHMINRIELARAVPGVRLAGVDEIERRDDSGSSVSPRTAGE